MLIRLIYASTVSDGVDLNELKRILQQSQANNQRRDLTGILAFNSKIVLQALEGGREEVNALYSKLLRDDRHHTVTMLKYEEVEERNWSQWSMGFAAQHTDNRAIFLKYSRHSSFNPYAMGGDAVEKMLMELAGKTISMTVPATAMDATPARPAVAPIVTAPQSLGATPVRPATAAPLQGATMVQPVRTQPVQPAQAAPGVQPAPAAAATSVPGAAAASDAARAAARVTPESNLVSRLINR